MLKNIADVAGFPFRENDQVIFTYLKIICYQNDTFKAICSIRPSRETSLGLSNHLGFEYLLKL
jgi:hypothetical protein